MNVAIFWYVAHLCSMKTDGATAVSVKGVSQCIVGYPSFILLQFFDKMLWTYI